MPTYMVGTYRWLATATNPQPKGTTPMLLLALLFALALAPAVAVFVLHCYVRPLQAHLAARSAAALHPTCNAVAMGAGYNYWLQAPPMQVAMPRTRTRTWVGLQVG